ncbi:hypothetical protein Fcan01_00264 [Folsomia candida]|uniref:Uncharacterized protein n=1 Tax=Folsomia candida TaxID=158441 RepID=A0A226EUN5_FOLCA|nr:hypothetical protein Fcan01_00264 [Folsomia candida]
MVYLIPFIILALMANCTCENRDYSKLKLKQFARKHLDSLIKVRPNTDDRYTGCMCPPSLNTKGSFYSLCGHELNPKVGGTCVKESGYRCIDGHAEAILTQDCAAQSAQQGKKLHCADLTEECDADCKLQGTKSCLP